MIFPNGRKIPQIKMRRKPFCSRTIQKADTFCHFKMCHFPQNNQSVKLNSYQHFAAYSTITHFTNYCEKLVGATYKIVIVGNLIWKFANWKNLNANYMSVFFATLKLKIWKTWWQLNLIYLTPGFFQNAPIHGPNKVLKIKTHEIVHTDMMYYFRVRELPSTSGPPPPPAAWTGQYSAGL